ncbi:MAG TPA: hypothetical protein VN709_01500 [Terriglobales bacterium]|nr:hypothetical protein [Terriglobales bacterium]
MRGNAVFPLLYWFGLLVALTGIALRYWTTWPHLGSALALVGVAVLILARVATRHQARKYPRR